MSLPVQKASNNPEDSRGKNPKKLKENCFFRVFIEYSCIFSVKALGIFSDK